MPKFRAGFVTNSSSSSFIVAFDKIPKTIEDVKNILFDKDDTVYVGPYDWHDPFPIEHVAEYILSGIKPLNSKEEVIRALNGMDGDGMPDFGEYFKDENGVFLSSEKREKAWTKYNKALEVYLNKEYAKFIKKVGKNKKIVKIEISDDDKLGAAMEHGDIFDKVQHIKINNH